MGKLTFYKGTYETQKTIGLQCRFVGHCPGIGGGL